jgi:cutinase
MKLTAILTIISAANALPQSLSEIMPGFGSFQIPFGPAPTGCNDYELIIGRGTSEPGDYGVIVGDPVLERVQKSLPGARGYAVQYPADATLVSASSGATDVIKRLTAQSAACPNQKFALVGYSQGGRVMHLALPKVDKALLSRIVAIAVFGDPGQKGTGTAERPTPAFPDELKSKVVWNCAKGDPACDKDAKGDFSAHLTYSNPETLFIGQSAKFIVAGFKGETLPATQNNPTGPVKTA